MASPPRLPNLEPKDMQWIRWVTSKVQGLETGHELLKSNVGASTTQRQSAQTAIANTNESMGEVLTINVPDGPPQVPVGPILATDHATVTITWNGTLYSNLAYTPLPNESLGAAGAPNIGFNRVNVLRATAANGPYTQINYITNGSTSIVDANVTVGTTYWYAFVTVDNLGQSSAQGPSSSIVVRGVDLGTLNADVTAAIKAANDAGLAGQAAAQAAAAAAGTADSKAAQALQNAGTAQDRADAAYTAAQNAAGVQEVYIGTSQPTSTSTNILWIDTTNGANTPKRYDGSNWVAVTDQAVVNAASAAAQAKAAADAANAAAADALAKANTALLSAQGAQNTANGKNKVNYSTSTPSGSGTSYGDIWFQYSGGAVIGQWFWDNNGWQPKQLDSLVIANLDAGKITSGIISADRIGANSITAVKLVAGTINAASGVLADAVITSAKIADLAVTSAKIASLDAAKIQAGTITADKFAAGAISAGSIASGSIDTDKLAAGAVTTAKLTATAIDGMTITGAVFRTSGSATTTGVVLDSTGLRGYQNNSQTFYLDSNGNVSLTGYVNATGGNFTGSINAQSGYISGNLTVNGSVIAGTNSGVGLLTLDRDSLRVDDISGHTMYFGATSNLGGASAYTTALRWGGTNTDPNAWFAKITWSNSDRGYGLDMRGASNILLNAGQASMNFGNDGSGGQIWSDTIRSRTYATSNRSTADGNRIMVITPYGTLGALTGVIGSNYLSSSSVRFKHDIEDWRPDVNKVLALNPVRFRYNSDNSVHVGMIAEQVEELGLSELIVRDADGKPETIEYLFFGAALLHVAREQQKQIDTLMQRLTEAGL